MEQIDTSCPTNDLLNEKEDNFEDYRDDEEYRERATMSDIFDDEDDDDLEFFD